MDNDNKNSGQISPHYLSNLFPNRPVYSENVLDPFVSLYPRNNINISQYNGSHGFSEFENSQIALALAMELSSTDVKVFSHEVFMNFMELFHSKKISDAFKIYENADIESKQLIDSELDEIPWRISSEYFIDNDKIYWINSWIKIGWWPNDECEISPQFNKGVWLPDPTTNSSAISTNCFRCVVWEGKDKEMLFKLLNNENRINIELKLSDGYLIPVDVAFKCPKNKSHIFDLAVVEIGSLEPIDTNSLDILRIRHKTISRENGDKIVLFKGCAIGTSFIPESVFNILGTLNNDDYIVGINGSDLDECYDDILPDGVSSDEHIEESSIF